MDILFPLLRRVLLSAPETLHSLSEVICSPVDNSLKKLIFLNEHVFYLILRSSGQRHGSLSDLQCSHPPYTIPKKR